MLSRGRCRYCLQARDRMKQILIQNIKYDLLHFVTKIYQLLTYDTK